MQVLLVHKQRGPTLAKFTRGESHYNTRAGALTPDTGLGTLASVLCLFSSHLVLVRALPPASPTSMAALHTSGTLTPSRLARVSLWAVLPLMLGRPAQVACSPAVGGKCVWMGEKQ